MNLHVSFNRLMACTAGLMFVFSSCEKPGDLISEQRTVSMFKGIDVEDGIEVIIE